MVRSLLEGPAERVATAARLFALDWTTSMRTSAWVVMLLSVGGCTSNTISLDSSDDGTTSDTDDGTDTAPPADSGTDDGPIPECVVDLDCGDCGWCNDGVCEDGGGCCSAQPDEPLHWRCSPPWECFEDWECGVGMLCTDGECQPGSGTEILEPPACPGDLALTVQQLVLAAPLTHAAVADLVEVRAIDENRQLSVLDLVAGPVPPQFPLEGDMTRDLLGSGGTTVMAIMERTLAGGGTEHQIVSSFGSFDTSGIDASEWMPSNTLAAAWSETSAELWVATQTRIDRWSGEPALVGSIELGLPALALAATRSIPDLPVTLAVALDDGATRVIDPSTGQTVATSGLLVGQPIDLAAHHDALLAASYVAGMDGVDMTAVHRLQLDVGGSLAATVPFGAPGVPLELAVADLDGNGVDDVVVANDDGRLDLYLMEADGPICRSFLPLSPILDLEAGDVDGDGARDVLVVDAGPMVTAIHGVAP